MDHCFLITAADDESAHANPFLIVYDDDLEAIYAGAVSDKAVRPWIVEYVFHPMAGDVLKHRTPMSVEIQRPLTRSLTVAASGFVFARSLIP